MAASQVYEHPVSEQDIVSLIRNLCESDAPEGWLTERTIKTRLRA